MVEVGMSHEVVEGYDECWTCGKTLEDGNLVVEVQLLKVSNAVHAVVHLPESTGDHGHVYGRWCLSCALGQDVPG